MFDDFVKHCELYTKNISVNGLLQQGFNKLEINWLGANRTLDIKRVNEAYYLKRIKELESELDYYKRELDNAPVPTEQSLKAPPKYMIVNLRDEFLVKDQYSPSKNRYTSFHYVKKIAVRNLWSTLNFLADEHLNVVDYRSIVRGLIIRYNLDISADAFNGGRNRCKYMFPYYYYPLKVLENYGFVEHNRNGTVTVKRVGDDLPGSMYW
jgi:hypothetical protein